MSVGGLLSIQYRSLTLQPNQEVDLDTNKYALIKVSVFSSGHCALYLVDFNESKIISTTGGVSNEFGASEDAGSELSIFKKTSNGNIFIKASIAREVGIVFI